MQIDFVITTFGKYYENHTRSLYNLSSLFDSNHPLKEAFWEKIKDLPSLRGIKYPFWGEFSFSHEPWIWRH
jgi:hypothetical protein